MRFPIPPPLSPWLTRRSRINESNMQMEVSDWEMQIYRNGIPLGTITPQLPMELCPPILTPQIEQRLVLCITIVFKSERMIYCQPREEMSRSSICQRPRQP